MKDSFYIDPDITRASTLPSSFYRSEEVFEKLKENVFKKSWQWVGDVKSTVPLDGSQFPFTLLEQVLSEPLLLVRTDQGIKCLSNVCTHRGNLLVHHPGRGQDIKCGYHGRRFDLDGRFKMMPEFQLAKDFPRDCDHLTEFQIHNWQSHLFVGLEPKFEIASVIEIMMERIGFLPLDEFIAAPSLQKEYVVNCHWALYCDNYLEGFHIPFVHAGLHTALDYGLYKTHLYEHMNVQIGYSKGAENTFDLPPGHIDYGQSVAAYYYWIFPNMMFNFYPWGLSINIVKPLSLTKTRVSFYAYVYDERKLDAGAGAQLDKVEREDEFVVEGVQRGLQSDYYHTGRFSPTRETGVHHFHRLLAHHLNAG